ncbi:hypothetical protein V6N13_046490 [Hibiscus sabdariffa]|uniref:Uncharacterized protein n=1 Tax=Hibiscus sabdariffa TaxID=183260 RepID=A0ABR2NZ33_9ROSI
MKTISPALLFLIFLFSTTSIFSSVANAAKKPVLDSDDEPLRPGIEYYIVSTTWGVGGAALESRSVGKPCPKSIVVNGYQNGMPVLFYPIDTNDTIIYESTDVNIQFAQGIEPNCQTLTTWKLGDYDPSSGKWWLTIDGNVSNPGPGTLTSWFKIKNGGEGYVLNFCPSVCVSCISLCNEISRYSYDNKVRLGLTKEVGSEFIFMKASETTKKVVDKHSVL